MNDHDSHALGQLRDLWEPWYEISHTRGTMMPWHAKRRDNGSLFHAKEARSLHDGISDNFFDDKPPLLAVVPPAN